MATAQWRLQLPEYQLECFIEQGKEAQKGADFHTSKQIESLFVAAQASMDYGKWEEWITDYQEWRKVEDEITHYEELREKIPELKSKAAVLKIRLRI
jgi:hypothetical protein